MAGNLGVGNLVNIKTPPLWGEPPRLGNFCFRNHELSFKKVIVVVEGIVSCIIIVGVVHFPLALFT